MHHRLWQVGLLGAWLVAAPAQAAFMISLSGSADQKQLGYYHESSSSVTGGFDLDLGEHFRFGLSFNQQSQVEKGHKVDATETLFTAYNSSSTLQSSSLNLGFLPFRAFLSPYAFIGFGVYSYHEKETTAGQDEQRSVNFPGPQAGLGLLVNVGKGFHLKLSYTMWAAPEKTPTDKDGTNTVNASTEFGLGWDIW